MSTLYQRFLRENNSDIELKLKENNDELKLTEFQIWAINDILNSKEKQSVELKEEKEEEIITLNRITSLSKIDDFLNESKFLEVLTDVKIFPKTFAYNYFVDFLREKGYETGLKNKGFYKRLDDMLKEYGVETKYLYVYTEDILDNFSFINSLSDKIRGNTYSCYAIEGANMKFSEYENKGGKKKRWVHYTT